MKLIAHTFYATTRLRVLQIRPWPTSATIERRLVAEAAAWQEKSSGIDRGEGEGGGRSGGGMIERRKLRDVEDD